MTDSEHNRPQVPDAGGAESARATVPESPAGNAGITQENSSGQAPAGPAPAPAKPEAAPAGETAGLGAKAATPPAVPEAAPAPAPVAVPGKMASSAPVAGGWVAAYEHPAMVRFCHWLNAIVLTIMVTSGWRIFLAFPSFGARVPERTFLRIPEAITLGGWLGGGLQWHLTFGWVFAATGLVYVAYLIASGEYRTMLFRPRDIRGVWPMARHYFFFGPAPKQTEAYNPLQKLAYTTIVVCGALSVLTGLVILRPVQFSALTWLMGGFHLARVWHFIAMCGFVAFIPGHLLMVALHGWNNFMSMVSGWKKNPEYLQR